MGQFPCLGPVSFRSRGPSPPLDSLALGSRSSVARPRKRRRSAFADRLGHPPVTACVLSVSDVWDRLASLLSPRAPCTANSELAGVLSDPLRTLLSFTGGWIWIACGTTMRGPSGRIILLPMVVPRQSVRPQQKRGISVFNSPVPFLRLDSPIMGYITQIGITVTLTATVATSRNLGGPDFTHIGGGNERGRRQFSHGPWLRILEISLGASSSSLEGDRSCVTRNWLLALPQLLTVELGAAAGRYPTWSVPLRYDFGEIFPHFISPSSLGCCTPGGLDLESSGPRIGAAGDVSTVDWVAAPCFPARGGEDRSWAVDRQGNDDD